MQESVDEQHKEHENKQLMPILVRSLMLPSTEGVCIVENENELLMIKELLGYWTVMRSEREIIDIPEKDDKIFGIITPAHYKRQEAVSEDGKLSREDSEAFEDVGTFCRILSIEQRVLGHDTSTKRIQYRLRLRAEERFRVLDRRMRSDEQYHRVIPALFEDEDGNEDGDDAMLVAENAFSECCSFLSEHRARLGRASAKLLNGLAATQIYSESESDLGIYWWCWQVLNNLPLLEEQRYNALENSSFQERCEFISAHLKGLMQIYAGPDAAVAVAADFDSVSAPDVLDSFQPDIVSEIRALAQEQGVGIGIGMGIAGGRSGGFQSSTAPGVDSREID